MQSAKRHLMVIPVILLLLMSIYAGELVAGSRLNYPIVDTGQTTAFSNDASIDLPRPGQSFFGQDANYQGNWPRYRDNGDGTVSDLVTGLMWQKAPDAKKTWQQAMAGAAEFRLGGYTDWRLPSIKELYSLIDFRGNTGAPSRPGMAANKRIPYINTDYFEFIYGDSSRGERYIDAQYWSSTKYVSRTMFGNPSAFGVNFADGRIKGYPIQVGIWGQVRAGRARFVKYVRGNVQYGQNRFLDNGDGTISDLATGLMWMKPDSRQAMNWQQALLYAEGLEYAGYSDWRLPNAKELQSIVDYTRSPDTTGSAAISPLFAASSIINEAGQKDYPFYWSSTTHQDGPNPSRDAVYLAFGRGIGQLRGQVLDVHGAGAQRGDPKTGSPMLGQGPQGDARRVLNYVRCVRAGSATLGSEPVLVDRSRYPHNVDYPALSVGPMQVPGGMRNQHHRPMGGGMEGNSQGYQMQHPQAHPGGSRFVARLDRDGDGKVSRSEFDGPARHFDVLDRDRDGYLSEDEAPPPPHGMGMGRPGG